MKMQIVNMIPLFLPCFLVQINNQSRLSHAFGEVPDGHPEMSSKAGLMWVKWCGKGIWRVLLKIPFLRVHSVVLPIQRQCPLNIHLFCISSSRVYNSGRSLPMEPSQTGCHCGRHEIVTIRFGWLSFRKHNGPGCAPAYTASSTKGVQDKVLYW